MKKTIHDPTTIQIPIQQALLSEENDVRKVEMDSFEPLHHKLKSNIENKLEALLNEYESQFA